MKLGLGLYMGRPVGGNLGPHSVLASAMKLSGTWSSRSASLSYSLPPAPASANYGQVDVLGAGADIIFTGTSMSGITIVEFRVNGGAGSWTSAASLGANTTTTQAVQMPTLTAGLYDARFTGPGGISTLTSIIEAWAPSTLSSCKSFGSGGYNATTGVFTARVGANLSSPGTKVPASGGAPVFDGSDYLRDAVTTLQGYMNDNTQGSILIVTSFTNAAALGSPPYLDPNVLSLNGNGTIGLAFGTISGVSTARYHMFMGGAYRTVPFAVAAGAAQHCFVGRYNQTSLDLSCDGVAATPTTFSSGSWSSNAGDFRLGGNDNAGKTFRGTTAAWALFNARLSDADALKVYKWAQQRHGVT